MKTLEIEVKEPIKLLELIEKTFPDSSRTKHKEILAHRIYIASRHITQYDFPLAAGMKVIIEGDENFIQSITDVWTFRRSCRGAKHLPHPRPLPIHGAAVRCR